MKKTVLILIALIVLVLAGLYFSGSLSSLQGKFSIKPTNTMESEETREFRSSQNGMESEEDRE